MASRPVLLYKNDNTILWSDGPRLLFTSGPRLPWLILGSALGLAGALPITLGVVDLLHLRPSPILSPTLSSIVGPHPWPSIVAIALGLLMLPGLLLVARRAEHPILYDPRRLRATVDLEHQTLTVRDGRPVPLSEVRFRLGFYLTVGRGLGILA
ncbi:MAG: hypothetical protein KDK70_30725, partial [Myxococcales bacterium]|nr:hypothetical protein [Myxococcales bacterium]